MDKIRLGNDIEMRWSIFTRDGDNKVPYNLEGRALTLSVVNRTGESEIEFFAEGNIVTGVFRGRDQRILGKHGVILRENNGENGMRTIDACDAFELVACSCEEALGSSGTIQLFHLTFDSTIGAITGTIDPILNYEAEQAEAERKTNEIIRKANEQQRIDNEKQRNANEILRNIAEEDRKNAEQERIVNEDLRKADEAERKTNEESRLQSESERVSSEEERLYAESIRVANENARIVSEAKRAEAETARIEAEDKRIISEKNRLSAESSRIANEDSRRANEDSRLSAEAKRVSAEEERQAKFASMVVQSTGDATDKVMSQKAVTEALKGKQNKLTAGKGISIDGDVISATLDMDIVRVVDALPSVGEANIIYLVPAEQPSESNLFEEWVWTDRWERIGSAKIDLSDYATKGYVDSKISSTEDNLVHKNGYERITERKQFQKGIDIGLSNALVANNDGVQSGAWLDQNEDPAPFIVADPSADDHAATKYYVDEGLATKANIQHQHTVADITNFPELYYDATAFFTSGAYPSDKYEELLEAVKAKRTVYATINEAGYTSYVFFVSSANSDGSSSRVLLTTIFADGSYLYLNTFVLQQSGMTPLRESITGKADKATTLAGYGIGDAYTKSELDALLKGKQSILTDTDGSYGQRVADLEKTKQDTLTAGNGISIEGNEIGVTTITESESQPNSSLWINPSEDTETDVTYNRSQIDAMLGAKQDALQLTVKDNGNIVLSNIQGQSKEFMPATPSGDPMHYMYETYGCVWNGNEDRQVATPWAAYADDEEDKVVTHKKGCWLLNGIGDLTTSEVRKICARGLWNSNDRYPLGYSSGYSSGMNDARTLLYRVGEQNAVLTQNVSGYNSKIMSINISNVIKPNELATIRLDSTQNYFTSSINLKYIYGGVLVISNVIPDIFKSCVALRICRINTRKNLYLRDSPYFNNYCIRYAIENNLATENITITLHADAYARAMANADIVAALEAHPNVSLASA